MIGNDIVDLEDPETHPAATHPRFDQRVFTVAERAALGRSAAPDRERWVLWAAKEAAYKLLRAEDPAVVFSPRDFEVRHRAVARASVSWRHRRVSVDLDVRTTSVHALAHSSGRGRVISAAARCHRLDPSRSARALAVECVAPHLGAAPGELWVERVSGRPPILMWGDRPTGARLSLSHHGRFVAFACELPPGAGWSS